MVLAAGLGTRLRPLTELCAKPLVPVGDRPALAHLVDRLRAAGVVRIAVNAHHRAADVHAFVRARGGDVVVSEERDLLGTAGGVARAARLLGTGDVVVWNADIVADVDPRALARAHAAHVAADATLVVRPRERGQGSVGLDEGGRVVRLRAERVADEACGGDFLGIQVLASGLRVTLPEQGCLVGDVYIPALRRGARLLAFLSEPPFFDIGTPEGYLDANLHWLKERALARWIGPGARLAPGVSLERALLGEGASAVGAGPLDRCVVWPGACAVAPLAGAIVAGNVVVKASA
jgi:mannose-1-phosphate guanylyltransferase